MPHTINWYYKHGKTPPKTHPGYDDFMRSKHFEACNEFLVCRHCGCCVAWDRWELHIMTHGIVL